MSTDWGFNFRATSGFVTDGANETPVLAEDYPHTYTINGVSVTAGWEDSVAGNTRDRSAAGDAREAGINFSAVGGTRFRVDLPAAGSWTIHFAGGDGNGAGLACDFAFKDGTTALGTTGSYPGTGFNDANNTNWSVAAWPGSETGLSVSMSSTTFRLVTTSASTNAVAYLRLAQASSPPPPDPFPGWQRTRYRYDTVYGD